MREIFDVLMNLIEYTIKGCMLAWFLRGMATERDGWRKPIGQSGISYAQAAIVLQFVIVQMLLHGIPALQRWMYGEFMMPRTSITTIRYVMLTMAVTFLVSMLVYAAEGKLFCCVVVFYTMLELIRFAIYSLFVVILQLGMQGVVHLLERGIWADTDKFMLFTIIVEIAWNLLFNAALLTILWLCIREYKKSFYGRELRLDRMDLLFLMLPSFVGMLLCALLRAILYNVKENRMQMIFEEHRELHIIVPLISLLSLISILLSAKVFRKMAEEGEEKLRLQIYKERMRSMDAHMKDIEQLYRSVRGIKHDMRHYIADIGMLLKTTSPTPEMLAQFDCYVRGLEHAVEVHDMKYQTGNPVTDVIINRYEALAAEKQTSFESDFIFPESFGISVFDLSVILNNALENALEACERMPEGKRRYITLHSFCRGNMFFVEVQNSFCGFLLHQKEENRLKTTKEDKELHGFGLKNIENCAEKYYGRAEYSAQNGEFQLCVMLQK